MYYVCLHEFMWVHVYHMHATAHGSQKRALNPLEPELQVVSSHSGPGNQICLGLLQGQLVLLTTEPTPASGFNILKAIHVIHMWKNKQENQFYYLIDAEKHLSPIKSYFS